MKIVTKSNFNEELYVERIVADNVDKYWGEEFVKLWNDRNWTEHSTSYLELVEDDYVPYDGYEQNGYY